MPELKEMVKIVKSPEEKQYLICIAGKDGAEDEWEIAREIRDKKKINE